MRKGHTYGTIICDLEAGKVIDLLPDREAATLAEWLKQYPTIEVMTRDRAKAYAEGAAVGAPQALQVADRWHLLRNLVDAIEEIVAQHPQPLTRRMPPQTAAQGQTAYAKDEVLARRRRPSAKHESARQAKRQARLDQYNHLWQLREKGLTLRSIAKQVGISERTANRWLVANAFPDWKRRARQPSLLDAYLDQLDRRWAEGCHNATQLWRELRQQGFTGSYSLVYSYACRRRHGLPVSSSRTGSAAPAAAETRFRRYSPRQAAVLFVRPADNLAATEQDDLAAMLHDCPALATTYALAQQFGKMIRQRDPTELNTWLAAMQTSRILELAQFAAGIERDRAEVEAALTTHWSNGPVEGHVNRLKLIKRQMYGRANLDLLRRRVLYRG
jgi:transposase